MTIFYNKPIQLSESNISQIPSRKVISDAQNKHPIVLKRFGSDSFQVTTQPLNATREQIEGLVNSNPRLQQMFNEYNLWN